MERCPQCRARLKDDALCPRCGADLILVCALENEARQLARRAVRSLLAGDMASPARLATAARRLHATPFHRALEGFIQANKKNTSGDMM